MKVTKEQLRGIIGNSLKLDELTNSLNQALDYFKIDTILRINHFLAQVIHESGCFKYSEEIASGKAYEGRKDLGNIHPGDGVKYKGRGYIQIAGVVNYQAVSKGLGIDFIKTPEKLEESPYNMLSAGWFWANKGLEKYADVDDVTTITKRINGGLNGFDDRKKWLKKCKSIIKQ